jgi:hypothetical protein
LTCLFAQEINLISIQGVKGCDDLALKEFSPCFYPMRGFLVWPKKELNAQGQHGVEDADPTRQYEVEVESRDGTVIVALAKGLQ